MARRGGTHPPECKRMLSEGMKRARGNRGAMRSLMKGYHACRVRLGAVRSKKR